MRPVTAVDNYWFRRHEVAYLATRPWVRGAVVVEVAGDGHGADILSRVAREVITDDWTNLPDRSVDAVVALQVPVADHLDEFVRVLRPAGVLIVSTLNRPGGARELTELLEPRFRVDRLYGVRHRGRLRRQDIVAAQSASPPATWHPKLRRDVARVTHRDFTFTEENVETSLDLFAIAITK